MIRRVPTPLLALALVLCGGPALAADAVVVDASGEAQGSGQEARTQALDLAFAEAVTKVLGELLSADVRRAHGRVLQDQIVRRARRYVTSFQVLDERRVEGAHRVQVAATVDRDLVRAAIAELGIDASATVSAGGAAGGADRPPVVLLLMQSGGGETETTFGSAAGAGGTSGRAFMRSLEGDGFRVAPAGSRAPVSRDMGPDLPVGDDAAVEMARAAGAGGAFVVGVELEPDGRVRGTSLAGARGRAVVRVLDASGGGRVVARAEVSGAGYGRTEAEAAAAAARDLGERAMRAVGVAVARYWPVAAAPVGDQLAIRIRGARSFGPAAAIIARLAATDGVSKIHPRDVSRGEVILGLDTRLTGQQIVSAIERTRLASGRLRASAKGNRVLVVVQGETEIPPGAP